VDAGAVVLEPARRAAALVEHLTDGILILDRGGIIRWVASSAQRQGLSPPELLGRPAGEALHGEDAPRFQTGLNEALARPGTAVTVEGLQRSGGRAGYADDTLTFLPDTEGINGVMLVTRASARALPVRERLARSGLGETEEQLRQAVRLTHIGVFDHDHLTGEVYWSPEIRRIYGWGETDPVVVVDRQTSTANTWSLIHPQDRDLVAAALKRAHGGDGDGLFDIEYRIVRKDGELRWLSTRSQTLFEGEGAARHAVRTVGAVQDITARKQVERHIQLMQMSVDRCSTAIYWVNSSGEVTYANECACRSLGLRREQLVGLHVWDFDPDFPPAVWRAAWQRVKREHYVTLQTRHRRRDGTIFPIDVLGTYIAFENEEVVFVFAQDISERERAERELQLMHAAIEKSHTPFYEISPSGQIIYANEHACRSLGYTRQELILGHRPRVSAGDAAAGLGGRPQSGDRANRVDPSAQGRELPAGGGDLQLFLLQG
jgi:PAS domain S-box-containing protein